MAISAASPRSSPKAPAAGTHPGGRFQDALRRVEAQPRRPIRFPSRHPPSGGPEEAPTAPRATGGATPILAPPPGIPELRAAARAAPPAIVAAVAGSGPPRLALSFGAALSVDLRTSAQGLELSLRPAPRLERAALAELPRLVEALRARGLRVARADVRRVGAAQGPARAR